MKYSVEEIGFILYNNRSVSGTISNFLDKSMDPMKLIRIERKFDWVKSLYANLEKMVEVDLSLLNPEADDEIITPKQLSELTDFFKTNIGKYSDKEKEFLTNRKIPIEVCNKWGFLGLSNFTDKEHLRRIGATCHPILRSFLQDGIEEGGIVQPLFKNGILVNCSIRRISDVGKLKYTLAVPDTPVWGLDDIEGEEVWICEGLFDMICLREMGVKAVSPLANRLLIFETHDFTYHGHPNPLACPEGNSRKSLIFYYYTAEPRPSEQILKAEPHRALWRKKSLNSL